jgi:hypothetical protein
MVMRRLILLLVLTGALAALLPTRPALADRPDRPPLGMVFTSSADAYVAVQNVVPLLGVSYTGTLPVAAMYCNAVVDTTTVTVQFAAFDPDLTGYKKAKMSGKQSAYVDVQASFYDGMTTDESPEVKVGSCRMHWSLKDKDKNLSFYDPTDVLSAKVVCGKDLAAELSLDATQTDQVTQAFGDKPKCEFEGAPVAGCFRGDTLVDTEKGPRMIRDVRVGDRVWSWNEKTGAKELSTVTQTIVRPPEGLREVDTGREIFHVTDMHPFWVDGKGWTKAEKLVAGDVVRTADGEALRIASSRRVDAVAFYRGYDTAPDRLAALRHPIMKLIPAALGRAAEPEGMVYNLEVGGAHTFFVGKTAVLVHNK